jgi:ketosteroid isomerase-like protein
MIFMLAIAGCFAPYSWAQHGIHGDPTSELLELENVRNQAVEQKDIRTLDLIFDSSLIYIDAYGSLLTKAQFLTQAKEASGHPQPLVTQAVRVHVYGDTALIVGSYRAKGEYRGKGNRQLERFIDTWVLKKNTWVCVVVQATPILH